MVSYAPHAAFQEPTEAAATKPRARTLFPDLSPWVAEKVVREKLRDPDSAQFGSIDVYSDRKLGNVPIQVACGSVNAKNGFGGYNGYKDFLLVNVGGIMLIDSDRDNGKFVKWWNQLCAGKHAP
jgi:hypothetical protein